MKKYLYHAVIHYSVVYAEMGKGINQVFGQKATLASGTLCYEGLSLKNTIN